MKSERKTYKAINFDFDTKKLALARGSAPKCYYEIRKTMKRLGFDHRQGSGYVSRDKLGYLDISKIVQKLYEAHEWLPDCIKEFDVTNVTRRQYSMKAEFAQAKEQVDARMAEDPLYAMQIKGLRERVRSAGDAAAHIYNVKRGRVKTLPIDKRVRCLDKVLNHVGGKWGQNSYF